MLTSQTLPDPQPSSLSLCWHAIVAQVAKIGLWLFVALRVLFLKATAICVCDSSL